FTTIKPNEGMGFVKINDVALDFGKPANPREGFILKDKRFVPVQMIDVAGLVPGAHSGEGMGNQFLDDLRQADVLIHVIDISGSTNGKGEGVEMGSYDPQNDIKFLEVELDHWYHGILQKGWAKFARQVQQEHGDIRKSLANQLSGLKVTLPLVEKVMKELGLHDKIPTEWTDEDLFKLSTEFRKATKPMIIACNKIDKKTGHDNFVRLKAENPDLILVPCSAESELALREAAKHELIEYIPGETKFTITEKGDAVLNEQQKTALNYIKENILEKYETGTGVQDILNAAVFDLLKYIAIHPGGASKLEDRDGNVLPDCFLMPPGTTALDFAYRLHSDFGDNFIRAIDVKTKKTVGKEHPLNNTDIVEIVSGK
ncbi:YchF-related putative GTPase, partial [Candidatus Woesearchaeota archaeon]|nr:YchF-related putative GTPase [Candidatus Woesearchaeota archaeon]